MDSLLTNANLLIFIIVINGEKINLLGGFLIIVSDCDVCSYFCTIKIHIDTYCTMV
jgi:hypothetical protein